MAILGPTAAGKSGLAMSLAERTGAEILSVDSMQVYRGMDVGTAKPSREERRRVPHHMVDVVEPEHRYTVAQFRHDARLALERSTAPLILVVGGSGLHFRAVVDPMTFRPADPELRADLLTLETDALVEELLDADPAAETYIDLSNPRRVRRAVEALRLSGMTPSRLAQSGERRRYEAYDPELDFVGIAIDRSDIEDSVDRRLEGMRQMGFLDEVTDLAHRLGPTARQAVGYRQLLEVVAGRLTEDEGFLAARRATMRLVKRQRTFFRRDPRLRWFDGSSEDLAEVVSKEAAL
ncbi:MAG TPA: tRNA (adenosine(37)-N6)-dimethylallyltransferase MiaA [Acidimicrobiia bacterium]|nr:tRNA (adenosine(37)-N6)-dimethylallyltransferase MiaA [Acidimicrobiia bacterium]